MASLKSKKSRKKPFTHLLGFLPIVGFLTSSATCILSKALLTLRALKKSSGVNSLGMRRA